MHAGNLQLLCFKKKSGTIGHKNIHVHKESRQVGGQNKHQWFG